MSKIIDDATTEVRKILLGRRQALEAIALRLIDKEVIDGGELRQLLADTTPGAAIGSQFGGTSGSVLGDR